MGTHESAKKRKRVERVYQEPEPKLRLLKPPSECSTPDLASSVLQEAVSALRKFGRKHKAGADDDPPEAA